MSNRIKKVPSEDLFIRALGNINACDKHHVWREVDAHPVIEREIKRLSQEKVNSFEVLSLPEVLDFFSDADLPSSQGQTVVMNEIVRRLKTCESFRCIHNEKVNTILLSVSWAHEHERIFLHAWLSVCATMEDIYDVLGRVVKPRCSRYPQFLILKRAAEILAEQVDTA